jgi:hypothetical protein
MPAGLILIFSRSLQMSSVSFVTDDVNTTTSALSPVGAQMTSKLKVKPGIFRPLFTTTKPHGTGVG